MSVRWLSILVLVAACGSSGNTFGFDALIDDAPGGSGRAGGDGHVAPYSHTITLDGSDDFLPGETFPTTSASYTAQITWDSTNVYLGYTGGDLSTLTPDGGTKWLFAYVDTDPGAGTGATTTQLYNTQHAALPTGFGAEMYLRWKCDGTFTSVEQYGGSDDDWSTIQGTTPSYGNLGTFLEIAMPRQLFGGAEAVGIVTFMINEKANEEGSYAGLYDTNFIDGYGMDLPITKYLRADFTSARDPNDPLNQGPTP